MIGYWWSIIRREVKALWLITPEALKLIKIFRTEWAIYKARKSTANFNSVLMWNEILR